MKRQNIEKCMPMETLTEHYNSPNILYESSLGICGITAENHIISPLMMPVNDVFKLDCAFTLAPDGVYINDSAFTIDEMCRMVTETMYNVNTDGLSNIISQGIYYMDTALCILFREDETPIFVTRNTTVLDNLQTVPGCKIWDIKSYLEITQSCIDSGNVTAAFISPTNEGYQIKYELVDMVDSEKYVIIPYVWYSMFFNGVLRKLRSGYLKIKFIYHGAVKTVRGTRCKMIYDSDVRRAVGYILQHPVNELGKLQFASECGDIYCISITDLINVS